MSNTTSLFSESPSSDSSIREREMGNTITGARTAKVMKVDGTTFRIKPPATAGEVLAKYPGHQLFNFSDVKHLGIRAPPIRPSSPFKSGQVYFLVELPRLPNRRAPRRAWSGNLVVSAKERLENLMLSRRSVSDLSTGKSLPLLSPPAPPAPATASEIQPEGPMQLRVRLPRAQVTKLMEESFDPADAAARIVELFLAREAAAAAASLPPPAAVEGIPNQKEKRTKFRVMQDQFVV